MPPGVLDLEQIISVSTIMIQTNLPSKWVKWKFTRWKKRPREQNTTFPPSSPGFLIFFLRAYLKRFAVDSTSSFSSKRNPAARKQHRQTLVTIPTLQLEKRNNKRFLSTPLKATTTFEHHFSMFLVPNIFFAYTLSVKQLALEKMRASRRRSGFLFGAISA